MQLLQKFYILFVALCYACSRPFAHAIDTQNASTLKGAWIKGTCGVAYVMLGEVEIC